MDEPETSWDALAERSRTALSRCGSVDALIRVVTPQGRRNTGEAEESHVRVRYAAPGFWRIDRDEELLVLRDGVRALVRTPAGRLQDRARDVRDPDAGWEPDDPVDADLDWEGEPGGPLGWAHPEMFRDPPAFRTPVSGPLATMVAGRNAWEVVLAAPGRKPYPLQVALDARTGLVLRYSAIGTPYVTEVISLAVDGGLPEDTFCWDGQVDEPGDPDTRGAPVLSGRRAGPGPEVELVRPAELAGTVPYAYAAVVGPGRTVFTAGACPLDAAGATVAVGDVSEQARQVMANLTSTLEAAGAELADIVRTTVYVASSQRADLITAWEVVRAAMGEHDAPSTLLGVSMLGYPDQLVEVEAIAVSRTR